MTAAVICSWFFFSSRRQHTRLTSEEAVVGGKPDESVAKRHWQFASSCHLKSCVWTGLKMGTSWCLPPTKCSWMNLWIVLIAIVRPRWRICGLACACLGLTTPSRLDSRPSPQSAYSCFRDSGWVRSISSLASTIKLPTMPDLRAEKNLLVSNEMRNQ